MSEFQTMILVTVVLSLVVYILLFAALGMALYKDYEDAQGKKVLGLKLLRYENGLESEPEVIWAGAEHVTLSYFINQCEELDFDTLFLLNASVALTNYNRRKAR